MPKLQILALGKVYNAASADRVYLEYWRGEAQAADFKQQWELQQTHAMRVPEKSIYLSYVMNTKFKAPDKESRQLLADRVAELGPKMLASAIVMPQKGFGGAMVRSIVAGLNMMIKQPVPTEIFADLPKTYHWLAQFMPFDVAALDAAVQEFIRAVEAA
jgi:hypothetical protein